MACFQRASSTLKEILLNLLSAKRLREIDHQFYEFGSVQYRVQVFSSDPDYVLLSITTSLQSQGLPQANSIPYHALQGLYSNMVEVVQPPKEGYQLTLKIDITKMPQRKEDRIRVVTEICSVQAVLLSSQLKEMLWHLFSLDNFRMMFKPIKLVYHPREPFYVVRQPDKITVIFPMRFQDNSDVVIATTLFQELRYVGSSGSCTKAPPCSWSPIPPVELRGESFEDLSTNGGFVSFDIFSHHIENSKLDKTVWNLLNFYAFVKCHVKCTRGLIQRRMRKRMEILSEVLQKTGIARNELADRKAPRNNRCLRKMKSFSKSIILKRRCGFFARNIKIVHSQIKAHGLDRLRRRWTRVTRSIPN
ncbi:hypothetical protein Sjap_008401 [Stephania japonica]|uniref:Arp2/3 complex 34 kDa subunit n=1 Tax=Stephania japonica TaxID=461633 RepID=A0AAP0JRU1_9MAGN